MKTSRALLLALGLAVGTVHQAIADESGPALQAKPSNAQATPSDDEEVVVPRGVIPPADAPPAATAESPSISAAKPVYVVREGVWYRRMPNGEWSSWNGQQWQQLGRAKNYAPLGTIAVNNGQAAMMYQSQPIYVGPRRGLFGWGQAQQPTNRGWVGGFYSSGGGYGSPGFGYGYGVPTYGPWQGR